MTTRRTSPFDAIWTRLTGAPPSATTRWRVHELPSETAWGHVTLALDPEDQRHLLVPILSSTRLRTGLDGPGLVLAKRVLEDDTTHTTYADLSSRRPELRYLFGELCEDVVSELDGMEKKPIKALYQVVDRWRLLFERAAGVLSDEAAAGLFGELTVLERLLAHDPSSHRSWRGPLKASHDFVGSLRDIEVKTTTQPETRIIAVHGLEQLDVVSDRSLLLAWFRLQDSSLPGSGSSLLDLTRAVLALADDEPAVIALLGEAGYVPGAVAANDRRRYEIADERWYDVDTQFPRLTRGVLDAGGVPETVTSVNYSIDLTGESPIPVAPAKVATLLSAGIGEPE